MSFLLFLFLDFTKVVVGESWRLTNKIADKVGGTFWFTFSKNFLKIIIKTGKNVKRPLLLYFTWIKRMLFRREDFQILSRGFDDRIWKNPPLKTQLLKLLNAVV